CPIPLPPFQTPHPCALKPPVLGGFETRYADFCVSRFPARSICREVRLASFLAGASLDGLQINRGVHRRSDTSLPGNRLGTFPGESPALRRSVMGDTGICGNNFF